MVYLVSEERGNFSFEHGGDIGKMKVHTQKPREKLSSEEGTYMEGSERMY